ncbi:MAG: glucose-6-phosphate dehydrogenase assembly protein OpcA [Arachnia sp.]
MLIRLDNTSTREVSAELVRAHQMVGQATGMVLTLIVVSDADRRDQVLQAARESARAHPARVIVVTYTGGDEPRLDAQIEVGEGIPGDLLSLTMRGPVAEHAGSVVLPLLLPDSPTVAWWPHDAPLQPMSDPVGALASRRITDAAGAADPCLALRERAENHEPGDTDLSWTRLTRWRALLAAALDQYPAEVTAGSVISAADNAPALLLVTWLEQKLGISVDHSTTSEAGISSVTLTTPGGDIVISRLDAEGLATYRVPGEPERKVALRRRPLTDLLTEELQRLDADEVFESAVSQLALER